MLGQNVGEIGWYHDEEDTKTSSQVDVEKMYCDRSYTLSF